MPESSPARDRANIDRLIGESPRDRLGEAWRSLKEPRTLVEVILVLIAAESVRRFGDWGETISVPLAIFGSTSVIARATIRRNGSGA